MGMRWAVRMLLERNHVDPDKADEQDRTLLQRAMERRHMRIATLLQDRPDYTFQASHFDFGNFSSQRFHNR
ncbi:hypothetical protein HOY80DRAFT_1138693, partial [Tuber brumale]